MTTVRLSVAEALARVVGAIGCPHLYGIPGGKMTPLLKALAARNAPGFTGMRHEAAAALAATAEGTLSPVPSVAIAEQAPGMVNLLGGIGTARANGLPLVALTISTPRAVSNPPRGAMMEVDPARLFAPLVKASHALTDPRRAPELLRRAFREAMAGPPGPVHLDVPADLLTESAPFDVDGLDAALPPPARPAPDPEALAGIARLLATAKRPLLMFGGGVVRSGAASQALALAKRIGAPVLLSQMALGVVPSDHPLLAGQGGVIGGPQVLDALREADCVLAVGCKLSSWFWGENGFGLGEQTAFGQIDIDAGILHRARAASVAVLADARLALDALLDNLPPSTPEAGWAEGLRARRAAHLARLGDGDAGDALHPAELAEVLGAEMPETALVTLDGGHTTFWHNELIPARAPLRLFHDPGQAQLGFGLPFALALKRARPAQTVVCTTGDGSFGFTLAELDTARREGLPVIVVIHNNASWGVIAANQRKAGFALATGLEGTDYAAIARGFGCIGERIDDIEGFRRSFRAALAADLPTVLDCRTAFLPHPMLPAFGRTTQAPDPEAPLPW